MLVLIHKQKMSEEGINEEDEEEEEEELIEVRQSWASEGRTRPAAGPASTKRSPPPPPAHLPHINYIMQNKVFPGA